MYLPDMGIDATLTVELLLWAVPFVVGLGAFEFALLIVGKGIAWASMAGRRMR